jgi:argininosuccinate synthase
MPKMISKVVLAYSGGLDTSVILRWLKERYECEVIAFVADVGQGEELAGLEEKAKATGADKFYLVDLKEEFVRDFVFPAFRANVMYEAGYLLGTSLARPVIAKKQVEIALEENADAVVHGATGKGNDQVRFELTYMALAPHLKIIAPWREWEFKGRSDLIAYAQKKGIPIEVTPEKPYSIDRNILHISYEGGILEDPWQPPPADMFKMTVDPKKAPDEPEEVVIAFEKGDPVAVNGERLSPARLLDYLNKIGGRHGVGRIDLVENRFVGIKSRGIYETPGGTILRIAHQALETITMDREVMHLRDSLIPRYAELIYYGFWFSPEREALQAFIDKTQENVTGEVKVKLYKGQCVILGRRSPYSLYTQELATFEASKGYTPKDAEGFIRLHGLRLQMWHQRRKKWLNSGGDVLAKKQLN